MSKCISLPGTKGSEKSTESRNMQLSSDKPQKRRKAEKQIAPSRKKQKTKQQHAAVDDLDHKHQTKIVTSTDGKLTIAKRQMSKRSGDVIREEHDRKKRYRK